MKKSIAVLTLLLFFVASIGFGPLMTVEAMGLHPVTGASVHSVEPYGYTKKKIKDWLNPKFLETNATRPKNQESHQAVNNPMNQNGLDKAIKDKYNSTDLYWLAKIIHAEAKGEPFEGKVAVGAVIINRTDSSDFPDSIYDVIHQEHKGHYQFQPVANGQIKKQPDKDSIEAARQAIRGKDPTNGALYFYNPKISRSSWMSRLHRNVKIGNHVFLNK